MDKHTQAKWDNSAAAYDLMAGSGTEKRWFPFKHELFRHMEGRVLFLSLGTGLDIEAFPPGKHITAIEISPKMLEKAQQRIEAYDGVIDAQVMDVHDLSFDDNSFDQVFTSCTLCSVPKPVDGLRALRRVLKQGGELFMFEHTGSKYLPLQILLNLMTQMSRKIGPDMNRDTVSHVKAAGFQVTEVNNIFLDVVKTISARNPD